MPEAPGPSGFLVVDKPAGWTSHDVVDAARALVGHPAHRASRHARPAGDGRAAARGARRHQARALRAVGSEGLSRRDPARRRDRHARRRRPGASRASRVRCPSATRCARCSTTFLGEHEQIPPMYSAVKQGGVPLYRLARRGEEVERAPRKVRIDAFTLLRYEPPEAEVEVVCSPGTYVRVLAAEIGAASVAAPTSSRCVALRSGPFELAQAEKPELLAGGSRRRGDARGATACARSPRSACPRCGSRPRTRGACCNGSALAAGWTRRVAPGDRVAALDPTGASARDPRGRAGSPAAARCACCAALLRPS